MNAQTSLCSTLLVAMAVIGPALHSEPATPPPIFLDPAKAGSHFAIQGEYTGTMRGTPFAIQIIAKGHGQYDAVLCEGGLPGAGWRGEPSPRQRLSGKSEGEGAETSVRFAGNGWNAVAKNQLITLQDFKGAEMGVLRRTERESPTMGAKPPEGARVLFDGSSTSAFKDGARMDGGGLLMEGCTTKDEFGDCTLHLEFRLAFMPESAGQARSNSGLYLASRYEVQLLDSFGLNGANNECGGIYTIAKPQINMCLPPLTWQTYDIDFTAAKFDDKGVKTTDAQVTVKHNGVLIHDKVNVPHTTTSAPIGTEGPRGPLHLQNHGCPVRFRNFWVLPK
jgi:Domain of Unknown Function (DUF1080)